MLGEERTDLANPRFDAFEEASVAKRRFHSLADRFPGALADAAMNRAVRDDLHVVIGQQQVQQNAVVLFGVPDAHRAEHLDRTLAGAHVAKHALQRQRGLDRHADLAAMRGLAGLDRALDALHRIGGERTRYMLLVGERMAPESMRSLPGHRPSLPAARRTAAAEAAAAA